MNSVNVIGRLTVDPDFHHNEHGNLTATMHLAVEDRRNGESAPVVLTVVAHGGRAQVARYLRRDRVVAIEGRLEQVTGGNQHRRWQRLHVVATSLDFLDAPAPHRANGDRNAEPAHGRGG